MNKCFKYLSLFSITLLLVGNIVLGLFIEISKTNHYSKPTISVEKSFFSESKESKESNLFFDSIEEFEEVEEIEIKTKKSLSFNDFIIPFHHFSIVELNLNSLIKDKFSYIYKSLTSLEVILPPPRF